MFKSLEFKVKGVAPLIMSNMRMVDPLDPFTKELFALTHNANKKTDEGLASIGRVEWSGNLHHTDTPNGAAVVENGTVVWDSEVRVIITADMIKASIVRGGTQDKLGTKIKGAVLVMEHAPLVYNGPKDVNELMNDRRHILRSPCIQNRKAVIRTRPIFRDWSATFKLEFDTESINEEQVKRAVSTAGRLAGIGAWRPTHGRFVIVE